MRAGCELVQTGGAAACGTGGGHSLPNPVQRRSSQPTPHSPIQPTAAQEGAQLHNDGNPQVGGSGLPQPLRGCPQEVCHAAGRVGGE